MQKNAQHFLEFAADFTRRPPGTIRHVLVDWDGTISLGRSGWGGIMTDVYLRHLPALADEDDAARRAFAWAELMKLNGRPSIHQMARLSELIQQRGGTAADPQVYQDEFQDHLGEVVTRRLDRARREPAVQTTLLVPGVLDFLATARRRGLALTLASGTPLPQLQAEAELLRVADFFEGNIFGPQDLTDRDFSKRQVIAALLKKHGLPGDALIAFGDGPVELTETRAVGGLSVAVASDEEHPGSGRPDEWKRDTLFKHGAHAVIADFSQPDALFDALLG